MHIHRSSVRAFHTNPGELSDVASQRSRRSVGRIFQLLVHLVRKPVFCRRMIVIPGGLTSTEATNGLLDADLADSTSVAGTSPHAHSLQHQRPPGPGPHLLPLQVSDGNALTRTMPVSCL